MPAKGETPGLSRRDFLASTSATALLTITASAILSPTEGWGLELKALMPETMRTLIHMARDIYPHDRLGDRIYVAALKSLDVSAGSDKSLRDMLELGGANLNIRAQKEFGTSFAKIGWESDRLKLLRNIDETAFFQKVRSTLVTGIYNNREVWSQLGYEGPSTDKGGYINRGFDDIDWL